MSDRATPAAHRTKRLRIPWASDWLCQEVLGTETQYMTCALCGKQQVPEIIISTIEAPPELEVWLLELNDALFGREHSLRGVALRFAGEECLADPGKAVAHRGPRVPAAQASRRRVQRHKRVGEPALHR